MTVSQTVKEVLQSLVDDGLVQADKIGSSNCKTQIDLRALLTSLSVAVFWSFPSQRGSMVCGFTDSTYFLYDRIHSPSYSL